jgi:5-methylcytosine-specific restriction enzyme A
VPQLPPKHQARAPSRRRAPEDRPSSAARGYGYRWQKYRAAYLAANPLCVECLKRGETTAATVVDHVVPHRGDQVLFWAPTNHQPLCKPDHDRKTAKEDGGFGRKPAA